MIRRGMRALASAMGVFTVLSMTGCMQEVPLVSKPRVTSTETLNELRLWAEGQADATIAAAEVPEGWYWGGRNIPELPWTGETADREQVLGSMLPISCGGSSSGRLDLSLKNADERSDPFVVADRVRAFWESEGWTVTDVTPPTDQEQNFRADRSDGALLGFTAAQDWLVISVYTSCSMHNTVTNWELYRDSPNPFQEELDRREPAQ